MSERPIFKWRHFAPEIILCAVRWYLRYSLSYREVQELLEERDLRVDHTTVWRWVQGYAPELEQRTRPHLKPTNKSWRVDETYVRIRGHWFYRIELIDSSGAGIDFFLSAVRSAEAAKVLFSKALPIASTCNRGWPRSSASRMGGEDHARHNGEALANDLPRTLVNKCKGLKSTIESRIQGLTRLYRERTSRN